MNVSFDIFFHFYVAEAVSGKGMEVAAGKMEDSQQEPFILGSQPASFNTRNIASEPVIPGDSQRCLTLAVVFSLN